MVRIITAAGLAFGLVSGAQALTIDAAGWSAAGCVGQQSCTVNGATVSAGLYGINGATPTASQTSATRISQQDYRGVKGLGVRFLSGGGYALELQGPRTNISGAQKNIGEALTVAFAAPLSIVEIVLAHFYNPVAFSSDPTETAIIEGYRNGSLVGSLSLENIDYSGGLGTGFVATGASFASITRASFTNPKNGSNTGVFTIAGLFRDEGQVDTLVFKAGAVASGDTGDYSLVSVAAIPLPAGLWLALTGVAGAVGLRRRRRRPA